MCFDLFSPKPPEKWNVLTLSEFSTDIDQYRQNFELGAYIGQDIDAKPFFFDLSLCPHLLIGGGTGSGKSVLLDTLIMSIYKLNSNVEFVIIDPKNGAQLGVYDKLKNISPLFGGKIVRDAEKFDESIEILIDEMQRRYDKLASQGASKNSELKEPFNNMVIIIDEADAFMQTNMQEGVVKLAQKTRAAGMYIILATQTPNSNLFKQELRANFPARIALKAQNAIASKIIMDETGAEKLLGKGDMLAKVPPKMGDKILLFSPYLSRDDIQKIIK